MHIVGFITSHTPKAILDWMATPKANASFKSHHVALRSKQIDHNPHNSIHQLSILFRSIKL